MSKLPFSLHRILRVYSLKNDGIYLPFIAIFTFSLFMLLGLALDGAHLFISHVRVQSATDAGARVAMNMIGSFDKAYIEDTARRFTLANLDRMGISADRIYSLDAQVSDRILLVNATIDTPLYLLGGYNGIRRNQQVSASSTAGSPPIQIALVLDISGSMTEIIPGSPHISGCGRTKLCHLKRAARALVQQLKPGTDRLSIVTFNSNSQIRWSVQNDFTVSTRDNSIIPLINSLTANSMTCIGCGIREALVDFEQHPPQLASQRFLLVFTDGRPTQYAYNYPQPTTVSFLHDCGQPSIRAGQPAGSLPADIDHNGNYIQAVVAADIARVLGIPVYTVGLGRTPCEITNRSRCYRYCPFTSNNSYNAWYDAILPTTQYPPYYGDCEDVPSTSNPNSMETVQNPIFLRRLANDPTAISPADDLALFPYATFEDSYSSTGFQLPDANTCGNSYQGDCACIPRTGTDYPEGRFFQTADPQQLTDIFVNQVLGDARERYANRLLQ